MSYRPYFKQGIEQIQALVNSSRSDVKTLKVIQYELGHRHRPKARALKAEVDDLVSRLSAGATPPHPQPPKVLEPELPIVPPPLASLERVAVECANCKNPNFVSTLEGVVQYLSCSACKTPYEAQFKYRVMRTTFQAKATTESGGSAMKWVLIALTVLVIVMLMAK